MFFLFIPLIIPFPYFYCSDNGGAGETITHDGDGGGEEGNPNNNELPDDEAHYQQQQQPGTKTIYSLNINVCRLCLCEGQGNLQPVFYSKDTPDVILQHKILELTTVEVIVSFHALNLFSSYVVVIVLIVPFCRF